MQKENNAIMLLLANSFWNDVIWCDAPYLLIFIMVKGFIKVTAPQSSSLFQFLYIFYKIVSLYDLVLYQAVD